MAGEIAFYQQVVENMSEGVMALDPMGNVTLFNHAASSILGLEPESVMGKPFGQVFMVEMEGNDEFCQTILDAVYESAVGKTDTMEFQRPDEERRVVALTTSYLKEDTDQEPTGQGIVIVINDITQITRSREKEKALNQQLTQAFVETEETNTRLAAALKQVKWIRFFFLFALILGLAGTGGYLWFQGNLTTTLFSTPAPEMTMSDTPQAQVTVQVQHLQSSISLAGSVAPLEEIHVTAPFAGNIKEKFFIYNQKVDKGAPLIAMDTAKLEMELRNAKAAYIKAVQHFKELREWDKSVEVSNARRSLTRAQNSLENARQKLDESRLLFEKGIISRTELQAARETCTNHDMDYASAQESLDSTLDKGNANNLAIAEMELANARITMEEFQAKLKRAVVHSPVAGIAIKPVSKSKGNAKIVKPGLAVSQGDALLAVGNLDGLSIKTRVDEIDINKIRFHQRVRVSGDAFSDLPLTGYVRHISSNAESDQSNGPMFQVTVAIDQLTPVHRERIRLGMSTNLEIMVYDNPKALVVPLAVVEVRGDGKFVRMKNNAGQVEERRVETGITTMDAVEITQGLAQGDMVYYPGATVLPEAAASTALPTPNPEEP